MFLTEDFIIVYVMWILILFGVLFLFIKIRMSLWCINSAI